jgi:predicted nucleic acid-binding protein
MADAYLLDTSVATIAWDGLHKEHAQIRGRLVELGDDAIFVCAISIGEKEYGLRVYQHIDAARSQAVRDAWRQYQVLQIDHHTAITYGQLRGALFRLYATKKSRDRVKEKQPEDLRDKTTGRELGIQENDLWIVSIAAQYDLRFITRDDGGGMRRVLGVAKDEFGYDRAEIWVVSAPSSTT